MLPRTCVALLVLFSACATTEANPRKSVASDRRIANLRRAATLPWVDDGWCVVREASNEWPVLAEQCYHTLDLDRVQFRDVTGKCAVAVAPVIAVGVGVCLLAAVEFAAGAVVFVGSAWAVATTINEALDAYARGSAPERGRPEARAPSSSGNQPSANRRPVPGPEGGGDVFSPTPPDSPDPPDRDECIPRPIVPPLGGDKFHDLCAKNVPGNAFRGADVLVNGKAFDALQQFTRTLWEIKTDNFDTYSPGLKNIVINNQVAELRRERDLARACGFEFRIGVRSAAHKDALERAARDLEGLVVVMDWC